MVTATSVKSKQGQNLRRAKYGTMGTKAMAIGGCSEICCQLADYYQNAEHNEEEAALWYYNAAFETESVLNLQCHTKIPLSALADISAKNGDFEEAEHYRQLLESDDSGKC